MSWPASPIWLEELQSRFGALLRTPLSRETGALRAETDTYDPRLVCAIKAPSAGTSAERLAVYQRQYWFRLFTVLQGRYPLTARLLGFWRFNQRAAAFLAENPPTTWDIGAVGDGFDDFLERAAVAENVPHQALVEAARIDSAYHRVFRAPHVVPFQLDLREADRVSAARLRPSPAVAIVHEHWPLCELRSRAPALAGENVVPLPAAHPEQQHWLIGRQRLDTVTVQLAPREAELLELLGQYPVSEGLALLEERCSTVERLALPARARAWLSRSVQLGAWVRLDPA